MDPRFHEPVVSGGYDGKPGERLVLYGPSGFRFVGSTEPGGPSPAGGPALVWRRPSGPDSMPLLADGLRCAQAFARLAKEPRDRVVEVATEWGPLGLCAHGLPRHHAGDVCRASPGVGSGRETREPIDAWTWMAQHYAASLSILADASTGNPGRGEDWRILVAWHERFAAVLDRGEALEEMARQVVSNAPDDAYLQSYAIADILTFTWLQFGNFRLRALGEQGDNLGPSLLVVPHAERLTATLACGAAFAFASSRGVYRCDECEYPFVPLNRRPRAGVSRYCQSCQGGAAKKASKRKWWRQSGAARRRSPH